MMLDKDFYEMYFAVHPSERRTRRWVMHHDTWVRLQGRDLGLLEMPDGSKYLLGLPVEIRDVAGVEFVGEPLHKGGTYMREADVVEYRQCAGSNCPAHREGYEHAHLVNVARSTEGTAA